MGGPAFEVQAQRLVQLLSIQAGKGLQITGAAAAAQDPQHRHQQQEPLGVAHPTPVAAIGEGLEDADQVIRNSLIDCSRTGFGNWKGEIPLTKPNAGRPAKAYADRLLGGSGGIGSFLLLPGHHLFQYDPVVFLIKCAAESQVELSA